MASSWQRKCAASRLLSHFHLSCHPTYYSVYSVTGLICSETAHGTTTTTARGAGDSTMDLFQRYDRLLPRPNERA